MAGSRPRPAIVSAPRRSSVGGIMVAAALLAALLVPIVGMMLAGGPSDCTGDAVGAASAAVAGAQRLLLCGRDTVPVALPSLLVIATRPVDAPVVARGRGVVRATPARSDASAASEAERRF